MGGWVVLDQPPHSPDRPPSDFYIFGPLKQQLAAKGLQTDAGDVQHAVVISLLKAPAPISFTPGYMPWFQGGINICGHCGKMMRVKVF
jgi:hypothetical protein